MIPYTIRAVLIDKPNSKLLCPIKIIVTIKGKRTVQTIKEKVKKKDWNKDLVRKSHPDYLTINGKIRKKISEIENDLRKKQIAGESISVKNLKYKTRELCKYFQEYIDQRKGVLSKSTIGVFENTLSKIKEFDSSVTLSGIDTGWLRRFHQYLVGQNLSNNTVHKHWKKLKTVFLSAKNEGIVDGYPFSQFQNPTYKQTSRTFLTMEEVNEIETALQKPMDSEMLRCGYYFLLGCYSGLRISDWRRFNKEFIQGDRIILRAQKNGKLISLQMHSKLQEIVETVMELGKCPFDQNVNARLKDIVELTKITKNVTAHVARHTFAVRCAELGISQEVTAELLGVSKKTVLVYYKITDRKIDEEFKKWDLLKFNKEVSIPNT